MFYVIFGVKEEELVISREKYNLDEVPEGLNMNMLTREQQGEYMDKSETIIINPEFVEDYENVDFNNAYCRLLWD